MTSTVALGHGLYRGSWSGLVPWLLILTVRKGLEVGGDNDEGLGINGEGGELGLGHEHDFWAFASEEFLDSGVIGDAVSSSGFEVGELFNPMSKLLLTLRDPCPLQETQGRRQKGD
ncbi:hypothetical protein BDK51DRAFT_38910 [Blyttiomyces helicus]|uniref:Uncharacterized protein n=1 Tax=Blyttiomyces helicus TaxID=388810 RepID=A0A4P9WH39_9FUNG|nr:hypothetical protein BDK51DRAFT_38910 [Blyttiomyces helicus]|eukprot:RKO92129.1 hypothetical protein BDK51DRAFT_38910 [Blyttiomyces helicus]